MAIILMLSWWYSKGWLWNLQVLTQRLKTVSRVFAVKILISTLFSPWKQIYSESTFTTFLSNLVDNTVSRCIGAIVRSGILFLSLILSLVILIFGLISLIVWPFIPLFMVIFPILTISGKTL